jgi:signal transduction histidine kinase
MASNRQKKLTLSIALILLCVSAIGASLTIIRLYQTENWIRHTYTVEVALGDLDTTLTAAGRSRVAYVNSGTPESLQAFTAATLKVPGALARIRQLTVDNPAEQGMCDRLDANASRRLAASFESVRLTQENQTDPSKQMALTVEVAEAAGETAAIAQQMRGNEDRLLAQRTNLSKLLFTVTVCMLLASFAISVVMFWIHNRLLDRELVERMAAEDSLRQLSTRLMRVQDEEAKRFARALHDSLGQDLVVAKIAAGGLLKDDPTNRRLAELVALLDDSVSQTRTISYLLHPPLLDEIGFASAAKWFIEGYTQRTGVAVSVDIPAHIDGLSRHMELALFRILQEALTNIHRHSKSAKADVSVLVRSRSISLYVRDYGRGIPFDTLVNFRTKGTHVGVGLSGMKERVRELGGNFEIESDHTGTSIIVKLPLTAQVESPKPSLQVGA